MLSKISFGKRSNRHSECVPQAIRIVILSRADNASPARTEGFSHCSRMYLPVESSLSPSRTCAVCAIRDDAAALDAIRYTRGLRAKIFPRPDFQTK
jgi:hypothetical protein